MATAILLPKLGLTMEEGTVVSWLKAEGDEVKKGDPILEIETDKLTNEVEAPTDGVLLKIITGEGETVPVSATIGYVGEAGESVPEDGGTTAVPEAGATRADDSATSQGATDPADAVTGGGSAAGRGSDKIKASQIGRASCRERVYTKV